MSEQIPKFPPIPREDPPTAPPPDYGARRYVSAEMQRVAESDAPPDPATEREALLAEVKATHERIAELEKGQRQLSSTDLTHESKLGNVMGELERLAEKVASLGPDNAKGAAAASVAAEKASALDAKTLAILITTIITFVLTLMGRLPKDPPPAAPVVVIAPASATAPAPGVHP